MNKHHGKFCNQSHKLTHGDHLCEFYKDDEALITSLCDFVIPGLNKDEAILIIATPSHSEELLLALERRSIDVPKAKVKHQLIILDARQTLIDLMTDGLPCPDKFKTTILPIIKFMLMKYPRIRAYGEMVDLLYKEGNTEATLMLENIWTELSSTYPFSLLCGYSADRFIHKQIDIATIRASHNYELADGHIRSLR